MESCKDVKVRRTLVRGYLALTPYGSATMPGEGTPAHEATSVLCDDEMESPSVEALICVRKRPLPLQKNVTYKALALAWAKARTSPVTRQGKPTPPVNDQAVCTHGIYHLIKVAGLGIGICEGRAEPHGTVDFGIGYGGAAAGWVFERRSRIPCRVLWRRT